MRLVFAAVWIMLGLCGGTLADAASDCSQDKDRDLSIRGCTLIIEGQTRGNKAISYNNRGYAYFFKGDKDHAIADYDQAIRLDPAYAIAYHNRGIAYFGKADYDHAITDYDQAIRLDPKHADYVRRGVAYSWKGDYDRAIGDFDHAIGVNPKDFSAYRGRGGSYYNKGDYDRAVADFNQAILLFPKDGSAYSSRGWVFFKKGDKDRALADLNEAVRLQQWDATVRERRGHVLLALGDAKGALDDFNEALRRKADVISSLWGRGQVYEQQGLRSLALADYKKAVEIKPVSRWETEDQAKVTVRLIALETPSIVHAAQSQPALASAVAKQQEPLGRRVALIIGNSDYAAVGRLTNPLNDARMVATALRRTGFAEVIERYNLHRDAMVAALQEFGDKADTADWAVVYYAGHGIEMNGVPYLLPTDAKLLRDTNVADEAIALERVLSRVEAAKKLRLVILDACRNNPFGARMVRTAGLSRSIGRGLSQIEPEGGVLVAYAAKHGTVAQDGNGANSPFASALASYLEEPGLEIQFLFRKVRDKVLSDTGGLQEPFLYGSLGAEPLYFAIAR
jgi:tetratricopeptide (TPR) repeat protein